MNTDTVEMGLAIPLMMWIPARPLRAHTSCLWASSHSTRHFFCNDFNNSSIVIVLQQEITKSVWTNFHLLKSDQLHLNLVSNLFWRGRNSPLTACGWQQAWRRRKRGYNMVVTVRRSKLPSFNDQSEIFLSFTRASCEQTSCWRW